MKSKKLICGIDVSKDTLDVVFNEGAKIRHLKMSNNEKGHLDLIQKLGAQRTYVMESTGVYSLKLAFNLKKKRADVRVENPIVIKRYIQMNLEHNKTDKTDAEWIYKYAAEREPTVWIRPSKEYIHARQLLSALAVYTRTIVTYKNYLKSLQGYPFLYSAVIKTTEALLATLKDDREALETQCEILTDKMFPGVRERLMTIPGLGTKTTCRLLIMTNGFQSVTNYRQVVAFFGLAIREYSSGVSVIAKNRITKKGNSEMRATLYIAAISAIKSNKRCKELYDRIKGKGKNGKVGIIAVCSKLIKMAFAIATQGTSYQEDHLSVNPSIQS